jgi:predicted flap endonuclease-1-like 5' DNA nuclease/predicted  nucleic acid-binding Zn-ribbon protein
MNSGNVWFFLKILPWLAAAAVIFSWLGWWLRSLFSSDTHSHSHSHSGTDSSSHDGHRALQAEIDRLRKNKALHAEELAASEARFLEYKKNSLVSASPDVSKDLKAELDQLRKSRTEISQTLAASEARCDELKRAAAAATNNDHSKALQAELDQLRKSQADAAKALAASEARCSELAKSTGSLDAAKIKELEAELSQLRASRGEIAQELIDCKAHCEQLSAAQVVADSHKPGIAQGLLGAAVGAVAGHIASLPAGTRIKEASDLFGKTILQDDLQIVEGIGPKIKGLLHDGGISTWHGLAEASVERLQEILNQAGDSFAVHNPSTWPRQAAMAHDAKWAELKAWQDSLDGGKE